MIPVSLTTDFGRSPMGIDSPRPRFSWQLRSPRHAAQQSSYELQVASTSSIFEKADLWSPGPIASSQCVGIEYRGSPLASTQRVYWRVRVTDEAGDVSPWSEPAEFTTGIYHDADWLARWVTTPTDPASRLPLFRRRFTVPDQCDRAVLHVCGLGHHEVFINGTKVGSHLLSPGWTKYDKTCLYETFDITAQLRPSAQNTIGVMLGNGMYNVPDRKDSPGRYAKFTATFGPPKLIAQLYLFRGTQQLMAVFTGDDRWLTTPGPITFSCTYGGEDFDARSLPARWAEPEASDDHWLPAVICEGPGGVLRGYSHSAPPLVEHERYAPRGQQAPFDCTTIYDLGQNISMIPELSLSGPAGSAVRITPAELIHPSGKLDRRSAAHDAADSHWKYTLGGSPASETWSPKFTYNGARYLQVERLASADGSLPTVQKIESVAVHSAAEPVGEFVCSLDLFNRTRTLIRNAQRSNLVSVLTDCPHREKLGWLEQYHLHGPSLRFEFDLTRLFAKIMQDMADSQTPDGLIPDIAPEYVKFSGGFRDSPEWGSAAVLVPWQQYVWTGDDTLFLRYFDVMCRYVRYLSSKAQDHVLSHGLGDWYDIGPKPPGRSQLTPIALTATAFYHEVVRVTAAVARIIDRATEASEFEGLARSIKHAFNGRFLDPGQGHYATGSQTAQAIPLVMGLVPDEFRPAVINALCDDVTKSRLTAGDIGHRFLLRALADAGRSDLIYDLHTDTTRPGYGYILDRGATSLTEAWDARPDSSHNHFMLGHIIEWFYSDLAGIRPDENAPGFAHFVVAPQFLAQLDSVRASHQSLRGTITSAWRRVANSLTVDVSVPVSATATVLLPATSGLKVALSNVPVERYPGVSKFAQDGSGCRMLLASGAYSFTFPAS